MKKFLMCIFATLFLCPAFGEDDGWVDNLKNNFKRYAKEATLAIEAGVDKALNDERVKTGIAYATGGGSILVTGAIDAMNSETTKEALIKAGTSFSNSASFMATGGAGYLASEYQESKIREKEAHEKVEAEAQRRAAVKNAKTAPDLLSANGKCIHVNDKGVEAAVYGMAHKYAKGREDIARQQMMDIFYSSYTVADAQICIDTVLKMCVVMLNRTSVPSIEEKEAVSACQDLKNYLAYTMQFPAACNGKTGKCNQVFNYGTKVTIADGRALIEFLVQTKTPKMSVWCDEKNIEMRNNQDYYKCKLTDGKGILDYEFEFDSLDHSFDAIYGIDDFGSRRNLVNAAVPIAWPDSKYEIESKNKFRDKVAIVQGVSKPECEKYNENISKIFGGYAKSVNDGKDCETMWYPPSQQNTTNSLAKDLTDTLGIRHDIFSGLELKNSGEIHDFLILFIKHKASALGYVAEGVNCAYSAGDLNYTNADIFDDYVFDEKSQRYVYRTSPINSHFFTDHEKYILCTVDKLTGNGKEYTNQSQMFMFKDMSEKTKYRSVAGLSGFKCATKFGGTFDGQNCRGLSREECESDVVNNATPGGTEWNEDLQACVLKDAKLLDQVDYAAGKAKKYAELSIGVALSVVAAFPSGGVSILGVVAAVGAAVTETMEVVKDISKLNGDNELKRMLGDAEQAKSACWKNKDVSDCEDCMILLSIAEKKYGTLAEPQTKNAMDSLLADCLVKIPDDPFYKDGYFNAYIKQEASKNESGWATLYKTADVVGKVSAFVAFSAGLLNMTTLGGKDGILVRRQGTNPQLTQTMNSVGDAINKDTYVNKLYKSTGKLGDIVETEAAVRKKIMGTEGKIWKSAKYLQQAEEYIDKNGSKRLPINVSANQEWSWKEMKYVNTH